MNEAEQVRVQMTGEVRRLLEDRMILQDEAWAVIQQAEAAGRKLISLATGRFLAYYRPKAVTYWVEYTPAGATFQIFTAYSHRMVTKSSGTTAEWVKSGNTSNWLCNKCQITLEVQTVRLQYMQSIFPINLPACSGCGFILISEELATGKMAEAEQALEDK